jgi:DMSO/TMAO reductase YedYZ molybdopterin-dependent catalytic subunit
MMPNRAPFPALSQKVHTDGPFFREEVRLANRNHGILLEALRHDVTPAGLHYLLTHFDVPYVPQPEAWTLSIGGLVHQPLTVDLSAITARPQRTLRVTLECAGNGRSLLTPRWPSMPWGECAVGTSEWTGTPLRPLLEAAGLRETAREIVFSGVDRGVDEVEHAYERSLSVADALGDDVLLVTAMNGAPLLPQHGFPLRLIVPGWYGMASVKWLSRIEVIDRPLRGHQQVGTYIYRQNADDPGVPVTTMRVKSLMVPPGVPDWYTRRRLVEAGPQTIHGRAWSGAGVPITRVEVHDGSAWRDAELAPAPASRFAWRGWSFDWTAQPGVHVLMCRAQDAAGAIQPTEPRFDLGGFGNNGVQRVDVVVR